MGRFAVWAVLSALICGLRTVIEVLGSDPAYLGMVNLLREARMIPLINSLDVCTLLALSHKTLSNVDELYPTHLDKERLIRYLLLKEKLTISEIYNRAAGAPLLETWLGLNGSLGTINPFGPDRGQVLRAQVKPGVNPQLYLGGAMMTRSDIGADNGVIHTLEGYVSFPKNATEVLMDRQGLSFFSTLLALAPTLKKELEAPVPRSLFVWEDELANATFSSIERKYLRHHHPMAGLDRKALIAAAIVTGTAEQPYAIYQQSLLPGHSMYLFNLAGKPVVISRSQEHPQPITYNGVVAKEPDVLTSGGVIHILAELRHALRFDAIKYIVGLDAPTFAVALKASPLAPYLLSGHANCTVLVPSDFVLMPSPAISEILHYHILPGQYTAESLTGLSLVPSFLGGERLNFHQQRIRVSVGVAGEVVFNDRSSLVGSPESIGGVHLLKVSHTLFSPREILDYISHAKELSLFYNLLKASRLENLVNQVRGVTGLLPINSAFQPHGQALLYDFLMRPTNVDALKDFVWFCFLASLRYSDDLGLKASRNYTTLLANQTVMVRAGKLEGGSKWEVTPQLVSLDHFVSTGVVHKTSGILAPTSQAGTLKGSKFLRGHADIFLNLVEVAKLTHLFEGAGAVLAPVDAAWSDVNLTRLERCPKLLRRTVELHFLHQRLPARLDLLRRTPPLGTLSSELPELAVVISANSQVEPSGLALTISNGPMALSAWNATVLKSGQADDLSVALVDTVLFLELLPFKGPSFLTAFSSTLLSLGGLGYGGYRVYLRFFPIRARGYSPISDS